MKSPFKFLDAYTLADSKIFFGRKEEVEALYRLVFKTELLLVYGLSGTGKTSLIRCGLASRFDGPDWYPLFIHRGADINESLRAELGKALKKPVGTGLADAISQLFDRALRPIYLIFDQFEELFILGSPEEQQRLVADLQALLAVGLPIKVLLVMREEYIGHLYHFERAIPEIFDFRVRVEPMTNAKVLEVMQRSFLAFNIELEPPAEERCRQMIDNISGEKAGIQLPYLQVYLDMLYREDYRRTYGEQTFNGEWPPLEFTRQEIESFGKIEVVLEKFLQERAQAIQDDLRTLDPALPADAVRRVLDAFVSDQGTKRPLPYRRQENLLTLEPQPGLSLPALPPAVMTACLMSLERARLLRLTGSQAELAHDSLAELIDKQRTDEQRQLNEVKLRLGAGHLEWRRAGIYLTPKQLIGIEPYLDKIQLPPHLQQFVQDSYAHNEALAAAEKERQRAELAKERGLRAEAETARGKAEQNARQARRRTRIALAVSFVALLLTAAAVWQYRTAQLNAAQAVELLLAEVDRNLLELDYDDALEKCRAALDLGEHRSEIDRRLRHIAYFFTESGRYADADSTLQLVQNGRPVSPERAALLTALQELDSLHYQALYRQYYPEMIEAPGGVFLMGCDESKDSCQAEELPRRQVRLDGFKIARTETTVWQYYLYIRADGRKMAPTPSFQWRGNDPMVNVNWYDAIGYANWLTRRQGLDKCYLLDSIPPDPKSLHGQNIAVDWSAGGYRLPTEAEWEYAARGGPYWQNGYAYSGSDSIEQVAWYGRNAGKSVEPAGTKAPNQLGLHDMSGNVWEWCWDWFDTGYYATGPAENPKGPAAGEDRILRSGSWYYPPWYCRNALRASNYPYEWNYDFGFRLAQN